MTPGRIGVIGVCRHVHKSHFACLCPLRVISLTHAIKDHLYGQITNLNPVRSERRRPAYQAEQITVPTLTGSDSRPFAAMRRHEELEDSSYPGRHDHSSFLQDVSAVSRGQVLIADPFTVAPCIFLSRIQRTMRHVRLMIVCNWISKKSLTCY